MNLAVEDTRSIFDVCDFFLVVLTERVEPQDMVVFQKLVDASVPAELVRPRGPGDHQPKREKPFGKDPSI